MGVNDDGVLESLAEQKREALEREATKKPSTFLAEVLNALADAFKEELWPKSNVYCLVDIGEVWVGYGGKETEAGLFHDIKAVVPLKRVSDGGMQIQVNGKELSTYSMLESGIAVPEWVAQQSGLPHQPYQPHDSMLLVLVS